MNKKFFQTNYKWIIPAILIVVGGASYFYYKNSMSNSSTSELPTLTRTAERGTVKSTIAASGTIATANYLAVTTSVNGIIKEVFVKEGDTVTEDQQLMEVTLDNEGEASQTSSLASYTGAQIQLQQARNQLVTLEATLRQKEAAFNTVKKTTSYQTDEEKLAFDLAQAEYTAAKNAYDLQSKNISQQQLSLSSSSINYQAQSPIITAPAAGTIANIVAVTGMKVENSVSERSIQTIASIKQEGTPLATVNITEVDINKIKVGQKVNLTMSSIDNESFTGTVVGIDRIGQSSSGVSNYPVIIQFENDSPNVLPNMSVDAEIIVEEKNDVVSVPSSAITKDREGKSFVMTPNGRVEVETGLAGDDNTEIISGINEGDRIVVTSFSTSGFTNDEQTIQFKGGTTIIGAPSGGAVRGTFQRRD